MLSDKLNRSKALTWLLLLFLLSIIVRIPTLNRPISKHHEFNTAVILIGIESWQQAGGASAFHFVPVMNYQNKGDYSFEKTILTDEKGNFIYMSFGPGWYIIPYLFFETFNLQPTPLNLQILNLLLNAVSVFLLFILLEKIWTGDSLKARYTAILTSCTVFLFSPNMLWFLGNGYVCTGIMLPFVLAALIISVEMLTAKRKINFINLFIFALAGIITIYIDWFGIFLYASLGMISIFFFRKNNKTIFITLTCLITIIAGIGLMIWQFASYVGYEQLYLYWQSRFGKRSLINQTGHLTSVFYDITIHFITSYLPVIALIIFLAIRNGIKKSVSSLLPVEKLFIVAFVIALIPFNFILLEWTQEHEFSIIPYSILFSFAAGCLALRSSLINRHVVIATFMIMAIVQYYAINRPGRLSQNGTPYNIYMEAGKIINKVAPPPVVVFSNIQPLPMIDYYAKRKMYQAPDKKAAEKIARYFNLPKSIWIQGRNDSIVQIQMIKD